LFIAGIYKFTVGAIINRPKKVCAIYAGDTMLAPTRKTFNRAICKGFFTHPPRSAVDEVEKAKIRVFYVAINNRRYGIKGKSALQPTIYLYLSGRGTRLSLKIKTIPQKGNAWRSNHNLSHGCFLQPFFCYKKLSHLHSVSSVNGLKIFGTFALALPT